MALLTLSCTEMLAVTLAFDDVPSGAMLAYMSYGNPSRVFFSEDFRATNHAESDWGLPHSPDNVLTTVGSQYSQISFGYFTHSHAAFDSVQSVRAYSGTRAGAKVRITAYRYPGLQEVASIVIGGESEAWSDIPIEISATTDMPFQMLKFEGVNSPNDLTGFCLDDMTITLIPEPSSLLALGGGLMGLAGLAVRRRRVR